MNPEMIIIVEDNKILSSLILEKCQQIWSENTTLYICIDTLQKLLVLLQSYKPSLLILDLNLPDSQGLATLQKITQQSDYFPIVIMSGYITDLEGLQALSMGAADYILKGADTDILKSISQAWLRYEGMRNNFQS